MAKPIEPTPILRGKDADEFLRLTLKAEEKVDARRANFIKECFLLYSRHKF